MKDLLISGIVIGCFIFIDDLFLYILYFLTFIIVYFSYIVMDVNRKLKGIDIAITDKDQIEDYCKKVYKYNIINRKVMIKILIILYEKEQQKEKKQSLKIKDYSECFNMLNILPSEVKSLTIERLKIKYRKSSKKYHPDIGGTTEDFQKLNDCYESLKTKIKG